MAISDGGTAWDVADVVTCSGAGIGGPCSRLMTRGLEVERCKSADLGHPPHDPKHPVMAPTVLGRQTDTARRQPIADQQQHFIKSTQLVSV